MVKIGMEDWLIDAIMEYHPIIKSGHASETTSTIEEVTGRKPILFSQFAKDYVEAFDKKRHMLTVYGYKLYFFERTRISSITT